MNDYREVAGTELERNSNKSATSRVENPFCKFLEFDFTID